MVSKLNVSIFQAPEKELVGDRPRPFGPTMAFDPMTSTLIYGEHEAVLVDALTTVAEAEALSAWVKLYHRRLTTIYITHGHMDHFAGLAVLKKNFPGVKAIATPEVVSFAKQQIAGQDSYRAMWPGQMAEQLVTPENYYKDSFELEGNELKIIKQGHTDAPDSTSLYVPSLKLVVAGDVVYNHCHMYMGEMTAQVHHDWSAALDRIEKLNPEIVVAGHKKPGMPDTPDIVSETRDYMEYFLKKQEETKSDQELFDAMGNKYPDWAAHQAWLMFGF